MPTPKFKPIPRRLEVTDPAGVIGSDGKRYKLGTPLDELPCTQQQLNCWRHFGQVAPVAISPEQIAADAKRRRSRPITASFRTS